MDYSSTARAAPEARQPLPPQMVMSLPGWCDEYSGPPSIIMDPEPMPSLAIPQCERVSVLVQAGQPDGPKPMPVLYSPSTGKRYLFTKKLVQEKVRVLIMLARELHPIPTTFTASSTCPTPPVPPAPSCTSTVGAPPSLASPRQDAAAPLSSNAPSSSSCCRCCCASSASCDHTSPCASSLSSSASCPWSSRPPAAATMPSCSSSAAASATTVWAPGEAVVIKVTDKNYLRQDGELIENPLDEVSAMKMLSDSPGHDNILGLLDVMQDSEYLYVVMPYLPGKDLFHKMKSRSKGLTQQRTRRILKEVISGLLYMKKHRIAHRDLSLENIMFDSKGVSKIIDFGMCVRLPQDVTGCCRVLLSSQKKRGKASYVCPEIVREDVSDPFAADVWSLGVILFIMLTLTPLYQSPEDVAFRMLCNGQFDELLNHYETLGVGVSASARSLIKGMLCPDAESRLTLEEVLNHPWMMVVDDQQQSLAAAAAADNNISINNRHYEQQHSCHHEAQKTTFLQPITTTTYATAPPAYGGPTSPRHHQHDDFHEVDLYSCN